VTLERVAAVAACALVTGGLVAGFVLGGSPQQARARALDRQRADDLQLIAERMVHAGSRAPEALPRSLHARRLDGSDATRDPATGVPYRYHRINAREYQLCATFSAAETEDGLWRNPMHPAGPGCMRFSVDHDWMVRTIDAER